MLIAFRFALLMMLLSGVVYPFAITGLGQLAFPNQANGSLIKAANGTIIGSYLVGQTFTQSQYFHSRPSVNGYDAANSGGSNLGATNKKLIERIVSDGFKYQQTNHSRQAIPIDAITASASGLDPNISLANALIQAHRIAEARKISIEKITELIGDMKETVLAETPYVNVLRLNLAMDQRFKE